MLAAPVIRNNPLSRMIRYRSRIHDLMETSKFLVRVDKTHAMRKIRLESENVGDQSAGLVDASVIQQNENFVDVTGEVEDEKYQPQSYDANLGLTSYITMSEFFSRPVEISSFTIAAATDVDLDFKIWDIWSLNPAVRAKLRNFAYFKGKLKVRVAISGTPFHYGRVLISYQPYAICNDVLVAHNTADAADPLWRPLTLNYLSQAPGATTMDVNKNKPVVLDIPFISPKGVHRLYNNAATAISDVTSYTDLENAGVLYFKTLNQIKSASATPSTVYVQIYAWAEDVKLGTLTGTHVGITTESEFVKGPVQKVASSAQVVTRALENVPMISPFAKASTISLEALEGLAALFGWSKPVMTTDRIPVKNEPYANGSQLIGNETLKRITADPMQELTIDGSVAGVEDDELVLEHMASRECYFTTFDWNDNSASMTPLWNCGVTPFVSTYYQPLATVYIQPTPMMFASQPFNFWRADIRYRFEIVCSAYHRGKLAIYWEPNGHQRVLIDSDLDTNKQFMKVIDIQETQSFEFCVRWGAPRTWLHHQGYNEASAVYPVPSVARAENFNGYIGVMPFTQLQSPDNSDIQINVYASAENFHVAVPHNNNLPADRLHLESHLNTLYDEPVTCFELNESSANDNGLSSYNFGEEIISFRSLLKRYTTVELSAVAASALTAKKLEMSRQIIPVPAPTIGGTSGVRDLLSYLRFAFLGIRGGMRKRVRVFMDDSLNAHAGTVVSLGDTTTGLADYNLYVNGAATTPLIGGVTFIPQTNGGIEFELPFFSANLFVFSFSETLNSPTPTNGEYDNKWVQTYLTTIESLGANNAGHKVIDQATGEDFSLLRFTGAPFYSY